MSQGLPRGLGSSVDWQTISKLKGFQELTRILLIKKNKYKEQTKPQQSKTNQLNKKPRKPNKPKQRKPQTKWNNTKINKQTKQIQTEPLPKSSNA